MNWSELETTIRSELASRELKEPRLRLSALEDIGQSLTKRYPEFAANPKMLLKRDERGVSDELARDKETGTLNGAEKSVLHQIFETLRRSN